jgi:hypothetical protein
MKIEMIVTGAEQNAQGLRLLKREIIAETQVEIQESGYFLHTELATYPPQREGSSYERTLDYQRSISVEPKMTTWGGELNAVQGAPYSPYLRGDLDGRGPAWMHKGRWKPLTAILESFMNGFINRLIRRLERMILRVMR